ncbi:MAG: D-alanine--D-alanine ligase [Flavobacteriia bacterium]|nr:D-alanine--D-alanine ligase [Flavobacteriia bacterium]
MKTIGIFCGGYSSEYEISIKSATTILNNFPSGYNVFLITVSKDNWKAQYKNAEYIIDLNTISFETADATIKLDFGLVYIHGNPGENGKMQAFLEMKGIPCINSGALASGLSFDKWYCNQFLKGFDIPVAKSLFMSSPLDFTPEKIIEELGLPVFVKPSDSGSSYGISKVKTMEELTPAIEFAFNEGKTIIIESFLNGTEVTCGVYRSNGKLKALPLTEIYTENEYFDYEAKYLGQSQEITPARVSPQISLKVQEIAQKVYQLLQLKSISRIDFMIVNEIPHVIEVNTTPGFSPASIVPKMIACEGKTIQEFWTEILTSELSHLN